MLTHNQPHLHLAHANAAIMAFQQNWDGETPYALATVVHTQGATAVKAGGRAIITSSGLLIGFAGGGCMRRAIIDAGLTAISEDKPRLIRTCPKDMIDRDSSSVKTYSISCASRGEAEIFLEPVLPGPPLIVFGETEIASHVIALGHTIGLRTQPVSQDNPVHPAGNLPMDLCKQSGLERGFIVVATQGIGDRDALCAALASPCKHILFVASPKKSNHWRKQMEMDGFSDARLADLFAPAGLDIKAKEASEIAVSIIAQIIALRRTGEQNPPQSCERKNP
ncbi:MAG: hypothetical protein COB90_03895 [Hyphomicrobiales bacterium]|nr:MAG: hypothetical protein COB90_03895 [Hyphomicrobiales bacterium]